MQKESRLEFLLTLLALLTVVASCATSSAPEPDREPVVAAIVEEEPAGEPVIVLETDKGQIVFALLADLAPETVAHFLELAEAGFFNRTTFHRVIAGDMIQGGSPTSRDNDPYNDGQGTSGRQIRAEFNSHQFDRGTVAMAHQPGNPDSGSCQFFIVLRRIPEWDGKYTAFGEVIEGIEVAEAISNSPLSKSTHPAMKGRAAGKQLIKRLYIEYRE